MATNDKGVTQNPLLRRAAALMPPHRLGWIPDIYFDSCSSIRCKKVTFWRVGDHIDVSGAPLPGSHCPSCCKEAQASFARACDSAECHARRLEARCIFKLQEHSTHAGPLDLTEIPLWQALCQHRRGLATLDGHTYAGHLLRILEVGRSVLTDEAFAVLTAAYGGLSSLNSAAAGSVAGLSGCEATQATSSAAADGAGSSPDYRGYIGDGDGDGQGYINDGDDFTYGDGSDDFSGDHGTAEGATAMPSELRWLSDAAFLVGPHVHSLEVDATQYHPAVTLTAAFLMPPLRFVDAKGAVSTDAAAHLTARLACSRGLCVKLDNVSVHTAQAEELMLAFCAVSGT